MKRLLVGVLLLVTGGLLLSGPASAGQNFKWLCKPDKADNPCRISLKTTVVTSGGEKSRFSPGHSKKPPVDCFYVYPTVSSQAGPNADLSEDPEIDSIAEQQAAQFTRNCRMFAPIYPQFTIAAIGSGKLTPDVIDKAYAGVKAAWNRYLKKFNHGRGVVLIGHSQGAGLLSRLITERIDKRWKLRKRLVSAALIGGNIWVPKGRRVGGQFKKVPACARIRETSCVIASSGFLAKPPPDALFGRLNGAMVSPGVDPDRYEIMCVNPARLDGSRGFLRPLYNTDPFAGLYGLVLPDFSQYSTQWVSFPRLYRADCRRSADGAHWLQVNDISTPADPRVRIGEPLGRGWGTHLTEVNDEMGNLVRVVKKQSWTYRKKVRLEKKRKKRSNKKRKKSRVEPN